MNTVQRSNNPSHVSPRHDDTIQFNTRESAMIFQYERVRAEWEKQFNLPKTTDAATRRHSLQAADLLDRHLAELEWRLPDAYICPADQAPASAVISIASAFACLLHNHRQTTVSAEATV